MKETGSFIELDLRDTGEFYTGGKNIARLNTARAGVCHALRLLGCDTIYLPYYLCPTVKNFLSRKKIKLRFYHITPAFKPIIDTQEKGSAILIVNYFGFLAKAYLEEIGEKFQNVIFDQSPAFFSSPLKNSYNVYSARKFFGVPDGAYVIGPGAENGREHYEKDFSSDHASFLFKRIEYGSSAVYAERMLNEKRLDEADIRQMSDLTRALLNGIDYPGIREKRRQNFNTAQILLARFNLLDPLKWIGDENVPMVYPLAVEQERLMEKLRQEKIYTGRWWAHVLQEVPANSFEAWLSKFMLPIPIDQRYSKFDLELIKNKIAPLINP